MTFGASWLWALREKTRRLYFSKLLLVRQRRIYNDAFYKTGWGCWSNVAGQYASTPLSQRREVDGLPLTLRSSAGSCLGMLNVRSSVEAEIMNRERVFCGLPSLLTSGVCVLLYQPRESWGNVDLRTEMKPTNLYLLRA